LTHHFGGLGDAAGRNFVLDFQSVTVVQPEDRARLDAARFTPPRALAPNHADGCARRYLAHLMSLRFIAEYVLRDPAFSYVVS
jgi:hypothetical protein